MCVSICLSVRVCLSHLKPVGLWQELWEIKRGGKWHLPPAQMLLPLRSPAARVGRCQSCIFVTLEAYLLLAGDSGRDNKEKSSTLRQVEIYAGLLLSVRSLSATLTKPFLSSAIRNQLVIKLDHAQMNPTNLFGRINSNFI